ncbi:MAG: OmpA family protein [Neomegalonema sp.]|nr:OmpA family protein [Neomegalonema sp.]
MRFAAMLAGAAALSAFVGAASAQETPKKGEQDGKALSVAEIDPDELKAAEIRLRQYLRGEGYRKISLTGVVAGSAQMKACKGETTSVLVIDRFGRVVSSTPAGECPKPDLMDSFLAAVTNEELTDEEVKIVEDQVLAQGYTQVTLLERKGSEMKARACRGIRRYALVVNPDGKVLSSERDRNCKALKPGPKREELLRRSLQARGYIAIKFVDAGGRARRALACNGVRYFDMTFTADAAILQRGVLGFCPSKLNFAALPPRPVGKDEIPAAGIIEPQLCQDILAQMIYRRPINFEFGKADLTPDSVAFLGEVAAVLARCTGARLLIEGHTDNVGSDAANAKLSLDRAKSVAKVLKGYKLGARAFAPAGFGERFPIASNDTDEGRAKNRRIELTLQWGGD